MFEWNIVFNKAIEIKNKYLEKFNDISYEKCGKTCLEKWINELEIQEYINLFKYLQVNQYRDMVLIRYASYSDVYGGEEDITDEIFWNMYDGFYKECRSLVIDLRKEIIVLSPFEKFFNIDQRPELSMEIIKDKIQSCTSFEISNKLDGSMQSARYVPEFKEIIMSGSQAIDPEQSWRLQDGYHMLLGNRNYLKMLKENPDLTFVFEYISSADAHVVIYDKEKNGLYLIGIRDIYTGRQFSYKEIIDFSLRYNILSTEIFNKTFEEILEDIKNKKSNELEGFVLNIDGLLVKIKTDDYVKIHRILSRISSINLVIKSIADNEFDDLISKVPNGYRQRVKDVSDLVFKYIKCMERTVDSYYKFAPKDNIKQFMIWVGKNVPQKYAPYVKNLYINGKNNYIKSTAGKYKKLKDMYPDLEYNKIFMGNFD